MAPLPVFFLYILSQSPFSRSLIAVCLTSILGGAFCLNCDLGGFEGWAVICVGRGLSESGFAGFWDFRDGWVSCWGWRVDRRVGREFMRVYESLREIGGENLGGG